MRNELIPEYNDMSGELSVGMVGQESILYELNEDEIEEFIKAHQDKKLARQQFRTGFQLPGAAYAEAPLERGRIGGKKKKFRR